MASTQQLQAYLIEAETAYHALMTGRSTVRFRDSNGEEVQYTAANTTKLAGYIASLKQQLGQGISGPMYLTVVR